MSNRPLRKKENSNDKREIAYEMTEKMPLLKIYAKNIFFELGLQHRNHRDFMNEIWNENILCNEPCLKYHILWKISFIGEFEETFWCGWFQRINKNGKRFLREKRFMISFS